MSFWGELKRRNVFKVGAAYVIVAWLIVQVANTFFPLLSFPNWAVPLVAVLVILGFPLALLFAWAFELTPQGIKKTEHVSPEESITHLTGRKLDYILGGLLIIAVGYIVIDKAIVSREPLDAGMVPPVAEQTATAPEVKEEPKTIAVLPFTDLSPEKDQEYFVDGLSEELLNCLSKIPGLSVTSKTSSFSFKGANKTVQEIAGVLGVSHILEGSVRKAGNELRITAQLIRTADDRHLWSETYDRELKDIFDVQENIASAVADELRVTLGIDKTVRQLGGTDNIEAYQLYLIGKGQIGEGDSVSLNRSLVSIDAALKKDPSFAIAWARKAVNHNFLAAVSHADKIPAELSSGLYAAQKAIELEPNLASGYAALGQNKTARGDWTEAESAYRKVAELTAESDSATLEAVSLHYFAAGHFKKAHGFFEKIRRDDPLNNPNRAFYMANIAIMGDLQGAEAEYRLAREIFGDQWFWGNVFITLIRLGAQNPVSRENVPELNNSVICNIEKEYLDSPEEGLSELRRLYADENNQNVNLAFIALWAGYFGDHEFAMEAIERVTSINATIFEFIWFPVMHEVRQLPRFKEFVREIGLVDYWNEFGWPDICRQASDGDIVCD